MGFCTTASTALSHLWSEQSGIGSAVPQAIVKLGPAFGAALLGTVLTRVYTAHVDVAGLPPSAAVAVKTSVFGGVAVAHQVGSLPLLTSVRGEFVAGINRGLRLTAGIAVLAIVLWLGFLPSRRHDANPVASNIKH